MSSQDEEVREETREERFARLRALPFPLPLGGASEGASGGEATADAAAPDPAADKQPVAAPEPAAVIEYVATGMEIAVPLHFPFTIDGQRVAVIHLLPPSFADGVASARKEISEVEKVARMASLPATAILALRWPDAERVFAVAQSLMPGDGP